MNLLDMFRKPSERQNDKAEFEALERKKRANSSV